MSAFGINLSGEYNTAGLDDLLRQPARATRLHNPKVQEFCLQIIARTYKSHNPQSHTITAVLSTYFIKLTCSLAGLSELIQWLQLVLVVSWILFMHLTHSTHASKIMFTRTLACKYDHVPNEQQFWFTNSRSWFAYGSLIGNFKTRKPHNNA